MLINKHITLILVVISTLLMAQNKVLEINKNQKEPTVSVSNSNAVSKAIEKLKETDYSIPSWTLFKRALYHATVSTEQTKKKELETALKILKPNTIPFSIMMTINGDPCTKMGFTWYTNQGIAKGKVQLVMGKVKSGAEFKTPAFEFYADTANFTTNYCIQANELIAETGFADNSKRNFSNHKTIATGLMPNTTYSFRVGTEKSWSDIGYFTTAKIGKNTFSFLYFTDPQANTDAMFDISRKTMQVAKSMFPNVNFALTCGDLVSSSGSKNSEWEYEQFFLTQQDIWNTTPLAPVMGNHDSSDIRNFTRHFNTTITDFDKNMAKVPGSVYSFEYGDALFMAMNFEDCTNTAYLDSLKNWMIHQVELHPKVKWRIAFFHKPIYTGAKHQTEEKSTIVRNFFAPAFDSLKIDLALQGHDHVYEVIGPLKANTLVQNAVSNQILSTPTVRENLTGKFGGIFNVQHGTLYFTNNSAGKKKYEPRSEDKMTTDEAKLGISNYFSFFTGRFGQTGEPTFSNISVNSDSINVITYTVNDSGVPAVFDKFKVIKAN